MIAAALDVAAPASPSPNFNTGAGGQESGPQGWMPGKAVFTVEEAKRALNPLQHLPVVGIIYQAATGETLPPPLKIAGSVVSAAIFGGPIGVLGAIFTSFVEELIRIGPDTSRPPVPEGMSETTGEAGVQPVTPGTTTEPGGYTTLATTIPDFLEASSDPTLGLGNGPPQRMTQALAAYQQQAALMTPQVGG